jgi:tripartite-type tricarboxylate transporter receptor subunit TctC
MKFVQLLLACVAGLTPLAGASAQDFPNRPVRFVVPYAAGGSGDILVRLLGQKLSNIWGQQLVVDNKPGAGAVIGTEFAARQAPDGYTTARRWSRPRCTRACRITGSGISCR